MESQYVLTRMEEVARKFIPPAWRNYVRPLWHLITNRLTSCQESTGERTSFHPVVTDLNLVQRPWGTLKYQCNMCGRTCETPMADIGREISSCECGSTVRSRSIIHMLSIELFGRSLILPDFPIRPDLIGWGMSDFGYADTLPHKLNYVNTYYHKEPRLDITAPLDPALEGKLDFLISTEVFEHINPPVSVGFKNVYRLLKKGGVFIFSVPYTLEAETREHFPDLYKYEVIYRTDANPILKNITRDGREQEFDNLVFHGGQGTTLEMRVFSEAGLISDLKHAGFETIKIYSEPCWEFGIYWHDQWSLPLVAYTRHVDG
jgi:hypothetical protein